MPREIREFRIVIASPNDLFETRKALFETIDDLNRTFDVQKIYIRGLGWEEYVTPGIGSGAQDVINQQLLRDYDILIALFSTKLGSPTEHAASGTIEEIEHAISNTTSPMGKHRVQVYFRDRIESTSNLSIEEFKRVLDYREALKPRGILFGLFKDDEDLQREVRVNIQRPIFEFLKEHGNIEPSVDIEDNNQEKIVATLSNEPATITEEFGLLDYQEKVETTLSVFTNSLTRMTQLLNEITDEMNRSVERLSDVSFVNASATHKKSVINEFSAFLRERSDQLEKAAKVAGENIDIFGQTVIVMAEIQRQDNMENYKNDIEVFLKPMEEILAAISNSRSNTLDFRHSIASLPRITVQFNQAKRSLLNAVDESLKLFERSEKSVHDIISQTSI